MIQEHTIYLIHIYRGNYNCELQSDELRRLGRQIHGQVEKTSDLIKVIDQKDLPLDCKVKNIFSAPVLSPNILSALQGYRVFGLFYQPIVARELLNVIRLHSEKFTFPQSLILIGKSLS